MTRLFSRHKGRHCRHGSLTGWSQLSQICAGVVDDFSRPRTAGLAVVPLASVDLPAAVEYRHPYSPKDAA